MTRKLTRALVVDDSAVVRQTLLKLVSEAGGFEVTVAGDPIIAMRRMATSRPDVIVLDLEMPRMDGLTFLRKIMAEDPIPVVVCSAFSKTAGGAAIDALEAGAVDVITKPTLGVQGFLEESAVPIIEAIRGAARAHLRQRKGRPRVGSPRTAAAPPREEPTGSDRLTVLAAGASTGGTEALRKILSSLPPAGLGVVIVQHMPEGFTRAFAERLNQHCALEVKEAEDGDHVREGVALVAPGNRHLRLRVRRGGYRAEVTEGPLVSRHRPSVDVLFSSVAEAAGPDAVGVILTGMGDDGAEGLLAMRRAGAATLAQDESSSVVYGMPKEAIRRRAARDVVPLARMATTILNEARTR